MANIPVSSLISIGFVSSFLMKVLSSQTWLPSSFPCKAKPNEQTETLEAFLNPSPFLWYTGVLSHSYQLHRLPPQSLLAGMLLQLRYLPSSKHHPIVDYNHYLLPKMPLTTLQPWTSSTVTLTSAKPEHRLQLMLRYDDLDSDHPTGDCTIGLQTFPNPNHILVLLILSLLSKL